MIDIERRIEAIIQFGVSIGKICDDYFSDNNHDSKPVFINATIANPWFTEKNILNALRNWSIALKNGKVEKWISQYSSKLSEVKPVKVAVINAGNIPFVGLHDFLSVLICGHNYIGKNASDDSILLPHLSKILCSIEPAFGEKISFVNKLEKMDVVIATGNNNSARYFEYYFGKYPNIIRKNRNGIGVLQGNETNEQMHSLGVDIFSYFGLGCRNVSKIYVPKGYDFKSFFEAIESFNELTQHSKYMNNFEYNNSVFLLKRIKFLQNGFLIVRSEKQIASPVSILHYEEYENNEKLELNLRENIDQLQCIVCGKNNFAGDLAKLSVDFGASQSPELWDYADGVDTINFLSSIK